MNGFVCAVRHDGGPPGAALGPAAARLATCAAGREGPPPLGMAASGPFAAAFTRSPDALRPLFARRGSLLGVGDVRLDHPAEVAAWGGGLPREASDLERVLAALERCGPEVFARLRGDFALVVWDGREERLFAARDAFGVRPLFHAEDGPALLLSSRLLALADDGAALDEEFVADFLVGGCSLSAHTVFAGRRALLPGHLLSRPDGGALQVTRLWSAHDFAPEEGGSEAARTEAFREAFVDAVRARIDHPAETWSQLSGGLDSSSVVSVARWLAERGELEGGGVAGTVTLVDELGDGDERPFSDTVVARWGVPNEQMRDAWPWQDDGEPPPLTDEPRSHYAFWARDREMVRRVRRGGGRVLLSGVGADHYLPGNPAILADLVARARPGEAVRLAARLAVATRGSFWRMLGAHVVLPFLPGAARARLGSPAQALPAWLHPEWARRMEVARRLPAVRYTRPGRGGRFAAQVTHELGALPGFMERGAWEDGLEMRYPFLDRRLVEVALRLPPEMRLRGDGTTKWVLREAMRGILPEAVRTRRGKGGNDARVLWALEREAPRIARLLRDPLLAQLGWVRAESLRRAFEDARCGKVTNLPFLQESLALETWLSVRAGRWVGAGQARPTAA